MILRKHTFILAATLVFGAAVSAQASLVYGLSTRNQLVSFDSSTPGTLLSAGFLRGMESNEGIVGIDSRPLTGELYALGSFATLYKVNTQTLLLNKVASLVNSANNSPIMLSGVEFGFDFNPTVDRIRITSDQEQNLRANPLNGLTTVDSALNYPNGGNPNIVGSAYTNNDNDPNTGTTLYDIDSNTDMLVTQAPPNNGTLNNVGALGVNVSALCGFDILTQGSRNTAFAALQSVGDHESKFYTVNLGTGAASLVGTIGVSQSPESLAIRDIAAVPEPGTFVALGLGALALLRRRRA
jgi:hypothetical protein